MLDYLDPSDIELIKSSIGEPSWFDMDDFKHHFKHVVESPCVDVDVDVDDKLRFEVLNH